MWVGEALGCRQSFSLKEFLKPFLMFGDCSVVVGWLGVVPCSFLAAISGKVGPCWSRTHLFPYLCPGFDAPGR